MNPRCFTIRGTKRTVGGFIGNDPHKEVLYKTLNGIQCYFHSWIGKNTYQLALNVEKQNISGLLITVAVDRDFDQALIKSNRGVDWVTMECWSRALINTQFVLLLSGYKESRFSQRGKVWLEFTGQMVTFTGLKNSSNQPNWLLKIKINFSFNSPFL